MSCADRQYRWRVRLREPAATDAAAVGPWLNEAIAAVQGRARDDALPATLTDLLHSLSAFEQLRVIVGAPQTEDDDVPLGLMVTVSKKGCPLIIRALAIQGSTRNLGYGAEAVYELEASSSRAGLVAAIPVTNGLAVYFWLRAGFRPAFPERTDYVLEKNHYFPAVAQVWMTRGASH